MGQKRIQKQKHRRRMRTYGELVEAPLVHASHRARLAERIEELVEEIDRALDGGVSPA